MQVDPDKTVIVAGNGPSLADITPGTVLERDVFIRTNSFFFEPCYFLGRRVDIAMIGGDPRVAPFVFETLWRCRHEYELRHWSTHDPRIQREGCRRFRACFHPMPQLPAKVDRQIRALCAKYDRKPTTGVQAALLAYGLGARRLVLIGMDFYTGVLDRYVYTPGRHYADLMGADISSRGADMRLHNPDLDKAILTLLNEQDDVVLYRTHNNNTLSEVLDIAPLRKGPVPAQSPRKPPEDWASWAGIYPIAMLKLLRKSSALLRRGQGNKRP